MRYDSLTIHTCLVCGRAMASSHRIQRHDYDPSDHYPDYYRCAVLYAVDAYRSLLLATVFIQRLFC